MWILTIFQVDDHLNKTVLLTEENEFLSPLIAKGESIQNDENRIYYECRLEEC